MLEMTFCNIILSIIFFILIGFFMYCCVFKNVKETKKTKERSVIRKTVTLTFTGTYLYLIVVIFLCSKDPGDLKLPAEFTTLTGTILGYYFGRSTALDNPKDYINKQNTSDQEPDTSNAKAQDD